MYIRTWEMMLHISVLLTRELFMNKQTLNMRVHVKNT